MIPSVEFFLGEDGWVEVRPNAIKGCVKASKFKAHMQKIKEMME